MPRTLCFRATTGEVAVAVGADYTRALCRLAFAADGAVAAPTLGVANAVGVVDADRWTLPVACVVGKFSLNLQGLCTGSTGWCAGMARAGI